MSRKHVLIVITGLLILSLMVLISGCTGRGESPTETEAGEQAAVEVEQSPTTSTVISEWKGAVSGADLVEVVNFLIDNKGKEIELAGEKHMITGKEELDVVVRMLGCCTLPEFEGLANSISISGKIRDSDFEGRVIYASVPADEIPKIDEVWNVERIEFESEARDFWMQVVRREK